MEPAGKSTEEKLRAIQELISTITSSDRMRTSSHFSSTVYRDEPILTTGRKMASFLPERYREMRAISRWEEGEPHGRWLSEAELFYRTTIKKLFIKRRKERAREEENTVKE